MKLKDFHYELPKAFIARYPLPERSQSKLLCLNKADGSIQHRIFSELIDLLNPNDLLVFNNTKVIPARIHGKKSSGGAVEILIERVISSTHAWVMLKASKSPKQGSFIRFEAAMQASVLEKKDQFFLLAFSKPILPFLNQFGEVPLPPYMERKDETIDQSRYQTVYAKHEGAVAAPTAGLHFDESLLNVIKVKGIKSAFVTLHVGAGTFQPVRVENIREHKMHREFIDVSDATCELIRHTKARGGRVIAVGTTSVRSLETAASSGEIQPFEGDTQIFIYPGYDFKCVDAMITNFHLPESTLLMLVSAFTNREQILDAYEIAIEKRYRFFSYGDAMFIT